MRFAKHYKEPIFGCHSRTTHVVLSFYGHLNIPCKASKQTNRASKFYDFFYILPSFYFRARILVYTVCDACSLADIGSEGRWSSPFSPSPFNPPSPRLTTAKPKNSFGVICVIQLNFTGNNKNLFNTTLKYTRTYLGR